MAAGDIVTATFPLTVDSGAVASVAVATQLAALFPIAVYDVIHTELVFDQGTKTKATVIVIAQAIT